MAVLLLPVGLSSSAKPKAVFWLNKSHIERGQPSAWTSRENPKKTTTSGMRTNPRRPSRRLREFVTGSIDFVSEVWVFDLNKFIVVSSFLSVVVPFTVKV